jgi:putative protease
MVELLAPAGNREAFSAAIEAGTNAVYLGGQQFGARQYANNFSPDELAGCIRQAHVAGVRVYVTVNTLVDDSEIPALKDYLRELYEIGADAAILQDIGIARIARRIVPDLPLHASTQMTAHDLAAVNQLADYGFERVILSRELSLAEIAHICQHARCKVETFVHGALCICYSGQCLMSSMIGGRSGNRGRCAQPCRLPYQLLDSHGQNALLDQGVGEYLLSPKDFRTIEYLPELIKAGVASFKIEGRMKRPEYVAVVVDAYRRAIDRLTAEPENYSVQDSDLRDLEQIFNRGFTAAHLFKKNGREMMSDRRPNNRGVMIGRVTRYSSPQRMAYLKLEGPLAPGDIIEAWVKVGGRVTIEVASLQVDDLPVESAGATQEVSVYCPEFIHPGDRVFKVFDSRLTQKVQSWYAKPYARRRIPISMTVTAAIGEPLQIMVCDREGFSGVAQSGFIGQAARNRPLTRDILEAQCSRLGNTPFVIEQFVANIAGEVMAPVSEINDTRRRAIEDLEKSRLTQFNRPALNYDKRLDSEARFNKQTPAADPKSRSGMDLLVKVDTIEQAEAAITAGADWLMISGERFHGTLMKQNDYDRILSQARKHNMKAIFNLPRIIRDSNNVQAEQQLTWFAELSPDAVGVANIGSLSRVRQYPKLTIHADYPLNLFNSEALAFVKEMGASSATLSPELTLAQVQKLTQSKILALECLVHGHLTLMISEFCALSSYLGGVDADSCKGVCRQNEFRLQDRKGEFFPVMTDEACRMHILNGKELSMLPHVPRLAQSGVERIRIEACRMKPAEIKRVTGFYRRAIDAGAEGLSSLETEAAEHADITRGHYFRGVL